MSAGLWIRIARFLAVLWGILGAAAWTGAERLPVKTYTIADGLPMDGIAVIRKDSRHLLWFGTGEGVAWFDGQRFTGYTTEDGLPHRYVCDVLEDRAGKIWIGTGDGLCLFRHSPRDLAGHRGRPRFDTFRPAAAGTGGFWLNRLLDAGDGSVWCGSDSGLYRFRWAGESGTFQAVDIGLKPGPVVDPNVSDLMLDRQGGLWIATFQGLYHRGPDGAVVRYGPEMGIADPYFLSLAITPDGTVWAGGHMGLYCLSPSSTPGAPPAVRLLTERDGLPHNRIAALLAQSDGRLWIGTRSGVAVLERSPGEGYDIRCYSAPAGLFDSDIGCFLEDDAGNLWIGTSRGALRIGRQGFTTTDASDGLAPGRINALFLDQKGRLGVQVVNRELSFAAYDGRRFCPVILPGTEHPSWIGPQSVLQDHLGAWWLAVDEKGLFRYPPSVSFAGLSGQRPDRIYTRRDGLPGDKVFAAFEDSSGDIWVSIQDGPPHLARWSRRTGRFDTFDCGTLPSAFREDWAGNLWIGLLEKGIWRLRRGRMELFTTREGFPPGYVMNLYNDSQGRLWIATSQNGAVCVSDPDADRPRFQVISKKYGLSSNQARFVLEDGSGLLYIGTARGVDVRDPSTGGIRQYTTADGLAGNLQNVALRDAQGSLWFGTWFGLSRLKTERRRRCRPPEIVIRGLRLGGIPWPLDELGQREVEGVTVPLERNRVAIDFAGMSFAAGDVLTFRYRLARTDSEWRPLTSRSSLDLVDMRPGTRRIEIQAINSEGTVSPRPAAVTLTILAPVWQRWWFIALLLVSAGSAAYLFVRVKVRRRLEVERIRTRIATDLHDDIGSSLTQMSILSEVAVRKLPAEPETAVEFMGQITATSRSLVDAMSDIVWAINPARDRFSDLVHRMRRFANDLFAEGDICLRFNAPGEERDLALGDDVRRQVYLVFKECLHNAVRHSAAAEIAVDLRIRGGRLEMEIRDNGTGFIPDAVADGGHGLQSMKRRAAAVGGCLGLDSRPGQGTRILLQVPLTSPLGGWWRRSGNCTKM